MDCRAPSDFDQKLLRRSRCAVADLDLTSGALGPDYDRYETEELRVDDEWTAAWTYQGDRYSDLSTLEGHGPNNESWRTDVSNLNVEGPGPGSAGAVGGIFSAAGRLYAASNFYNVVAFDGTTGSQLFLVELGENTVFLGAVPGAIVYAQGPRDEGSITWMW